MRPFMKLRRERTVPEWALLDDELFERVRTHAHEEVGDLIADGRLSMEAKRTARVAGGEIRLIPSRPQATGIWMSIWDDTVNFGTGLAGACDEIWTTADRDWERSLRDRVRCVREGRCSEKVSKGLVFPLKVTMRFEGVPSARGQDLESGYASTLVGEEGRLPMPETGEFSYAPW